MAYKAYRSTEHSYSADTQQMSGDRIYGSTRQNALAEVPLLADSRGYLLLGVYTLDSFLLCASP